MVVYCKHIISMIAYYQQCLFSLLSDIKEEIKGAVKEAMASTAEAISQAVGTAVGTAISKNTKIVLKELQEQQSLATPPNPPTPHMSTIPIPHFGTPSPQLPDPQLHSPFHSSPFESPSHPFSEPLLSPADSLASYHETPPYLPSLNPEPLASMAAPSWVPQQPSWQRPSWQQPSGSWQSPPVQSPSPHPVRRLLRPPASPTRHTLKSPQVIINRYRHRITPLGVGRVGITLARQSVFGEDVMATGNLSEDGLTYSSGQYKVPVA